MSFLGWCLVVGKLSQGGSGRERGVTRSQVHVFSTCAVTCSTPCRFIPTYFVTCTFLDRGRNLRKRGFNGESSSKLVIFGGRRGCPGCHCSADTLLRRIVCFVHSAYVWKGMMSICEMPQARGGEGR